MNSRSAIPFSQGVRCSLAVVLAIVACSCTQATEFLVVVTAAPELPVIATITAQMNDASGALEDSRTAIPFSQGMSFAVVPRGGDASRIVALDVTAYDAPGTTMIARTTVRTGFLPGRRVVVRIELSAACTGHACADGEVCRAVGGAAACQPIAPGLVDAGSIDASIVDAPMPQLPPTSANYSCAGNMPVPGAAVSMSVGVFDNRHNPLAAAHVCFCPGNVFSAEALGAAWTGSCGAGCEPLTTDATGHATAMELAGGWYAARVFAIPGSTLATRYFDSVNVNYSGDIGCCAESEMDVDTTYAAATLTRAAGSATLITPIRDCDGHSVDAAIVRAYAADGTDLALQASGYHTTYVYTDGSGVPDASAVYTRGGGGLDGLAQVMNIGPAAAGPLVRVEAWANTGSAIGAPRRVGCEAVPVLPDCVSTVRLGPLRSDYPVGHPCR